MDSTNGTTSEILETINSPYPGLRYYDTRYHPFFAGRTKDVGRFIVELKKSNVILLHGRTGCGKSSFLRAGVKPELDSGHAGVQFSKKFEVIRSGASPFRALTDHVMAAARDIVDTGNSTYGQAADEDGKAEIAEALSELLAVEPERRYTDIRGLNDFLNVFGENLKTGPVFVIDQAEEVFTLTDTNADADLLDDLAPEQQAYFYFLNMLVGKELDYQIVVSMRTEYKGRFDDEALMSSEGRFLSFFLDDLRESGIREAILKPTQLDNEVLERSNIRLGYKQFSIDDGVAENIAKQIVEGDRIPSGGRLPVLQVSCRRLWRQAMAVAEARHSRTLPKITEDQRKSIGDIGDQIENYVSDCIERVCEEARTDRSDLSEIDLLQLNKTLQDVLAKEMVKSEADGRAVTLNQSEDRLLSEFVRRYDLSEREDGRAVYQDLLIRLSSDSIGLLRRIVSQEGEVRIVLGHDSVALALSRMAPNAQQKMMGKMRMMMAEDFEPQFYKMHDLFPDGSDQKYLPQDERPTISPVHCSKDYFWDQQAVFFAQKEGFARRLGFDFQSDPGLCALRHEHTDKLREKPLNWHDLASRAIELQKETFGPDDHSMVLIPSDWYTFPGDPGHTKKVYERKHEAMAWCDLLITNMFAGNSLIGPPDDEIEALQEEIEDRLRARHSDDSLVIYQRLVSTSLKKLDADGVQISSYGNSGRVFLERSGQLTQTDGIVKRVLEQRFLPLQEREYQNSDPLVTFLMQQEDKDDIKRPKFIVGSSMSRAMAKQAGYMVYFGTDALAQIGMGRLTQRKQEQLENVGSKWAQKRKQGQIEDVAKTLQELVSHTVWNVSIPPAQWDQGYNRTLILRLASIGYYTVDQIRTRMDEFVMYLQQFANDMLRHIENTGQDQRGMRLARNEIRDVVADTLTFFRFEENTKFFDFDSKTAYWTDHATANSRSVAAEIYFELDELRRKTLQHFDRISEITSWLRYKNEYDPLFDPIAIAFRLKEYAWRNFHVFNFYDAERFMARARISMEQALYSIEQKRSQSAVKEA